MADQIYNVDCGFFNAVDGDRTYNAEQMSRPYRGIVSDGVFPNIGGTYNNLLVTASGSTMSITVNSGDGIVGEKWLNNPAPINITVPSNTSEYTRIDSVIVQVNKTVTAREGNIVYREGTVTGAPHPPALVNNAYVTEYRVANISVAPNVTAITSEDVSDLRGTTDCPWVTSKVRESTTEITIPLGAISKSTLDST
nr:hypothetical protein [Ruminococcus sp.]